MNKNDDKTGIILDQPVYKNEQKEPPKPSSRPILVPPEFHEWTNGICGCCSNSSWCCYALFCYFCVLNQLTKGLGEHVCVPCLPWCGLAVIRAKMRTKYGIKGSLCRDFCTLCWCNGCGACQMHQEAVELGLIEEKNCKILCQNCGVIYI